MVFSIPIDFCIEFWTSTFSLDLKYTEEIFSPLRRELSIGADPGCVSYFGLKVIQVFFGQLNLDIL